MNSRNALQNLINGIGEEAQDASSEWPFSVVPMDGTIHHSGNKITEEELHQRKERFRTENGPLPRPSGIDSGPPD